MGSPMNSRSNTPVAAANQAGGAAAAAPAGAAGRGGGRRLVGSGSPAGLGGLAGLGQAASVGALSVPQSWGWAATPPAAMLGGMPLASALPGVNLGAAGGLPMAAGLPMLMGGVAGPRGWPPRRAWAVRLRLNTGGASPWWRVRQPPDTHRTRHRAPARAYPVPAGFSTNGHAPPGYTPAIVYLPTNGHAPPTQLTKEGHSFRLGRSDRIFRMSYH